MKWLVIGRFLLKSAMIVEAESEKEAIEKAWNGEHDDMHPGGGDVECPDRIEKNKWEAEKY